jgi:hypothetical protein
LRAKARTDRPSILESRRLAANNSTMLRTLHLHGQQRRRHHPPMTLVGPELPGTNFTIKPVGPDHIRSRGQNSPFKPQSRTTTACHLNLHTLPAQDRYSLTLVLHTDTVPTDG